MQVSLAIFFLRCTVTMQRACETNMGSRRAGPRSLRHLSVRPATPHIYTITACSALVLARGSLASLELLEVPSADLHVAALLVHALGELLRGALAVVAPAAVVLLALLALGLNGALLRVGRRGL